jgi:hypothetical protein
MGDEPVTLTTTKHTAGQGPLRAPGATDIILRVAAALLGGYAFVWSFVAFGVSVTSAAGVDFHEAETFFNLLAFLLYLGLFLWAFAARRLAVVWAVLVGGALTMTGAAWAIQKAALG